MAAAALVTMWIGFHRSFYLRPSTLSPLGPLVVLHGTVFSAWVLVFLTQTALVATHRVPLHRRLGLAAIGLAVLIVVSGPLVAITAAREGRGTIPGLLVMLVDIVGFTIFMTAALCYRHRSEIHKRFMLLAMVSLLPPAVVRWPKPPLPFVASIPIRLVVSETDAWRRIASWLIR